MTLDNFSIGVIGLGYVGLPLALEFSKKYKTIGFDINSKRIKELIKGVDFTNEISIENLKSNDKLKFSTEINDLSKCNIYIVTVPTPINKSKSPDLQPLISATKMIGRLLKKNDIVIYESTVYPGCTEEECVPVLEKVSGLKFNEGFYCGYSPERINPGDKINTLTKIKKVTSGSNLKTSIIVDELYKSIITAGTYLAPSIKVAEASKAIENAQRDINISFMNELSLIFDKMGIDTQDVIDAASSKWNFLKFKPGLVGGHCIGVDPYYLAHKAKELGYHPEVILSGRKVNDYMPVFVSNKVVKLMIKNNITIKGSKVLLLGITFKENCPDLRNSKAIDIYKELNAFGLKIDIYDPHVKRQSLPKFCSDDLVKTLDNTYNAIILNVSHSEFKNIDFIKLKKNKNSIIYDVKSFIDRSIVDSRL